MLSLEYQAISVPYLFPALSFFQECSMLSELENVRQVDGEGFRRWFADEYFDLIVWYKEKSLIGFQLCYDKGADERALTWTRDHGYLHAGIDTGEPVGIGSKMSPVLVSDGLFAAAAVAERFRAACRRNRSRRDAPGGPQARGVPGVGPFRFKPDGHERSRAPGLSKTAPGRRTRPQVDRISIIGSWRKKEAGGIDAADTPALFLTERSQRNPDASRTSFVARPGWP